MCIAHHNIIPEPLEWNIVWACNALNDSENPNEKLIGVSCFFIDGVVFARLWTF